MDGKSDNFSMRTYLQTIESVVGSNGLKSILNYAHLEKYIDNFPPDNEEHAIPIDDLRYLLLSLNELFGRKGAHGLQLRVGRETFHTGIGKRPNISKALRAAASVLSETRRIRLVLEKLADYDWKAFSAHLESPPSDVEETEDYFLFVERDRFESEGITSQVPVCGTLTGVIDAMVEWITGGPHQVEEIECRAMGHPVDVIRVWKTRKEG